MADAIVKACRECGQSFETVPGWASRRHYCSPDCRKIGEWDSITRFWASVDVRGEDDCWLWKLSVIQGLGYGQFNSDGRMVYSHRFAWEATNGKIPKGSGYHGTVIRQSCDVRNCCNPKHLIAETQLENVQDAIGRRRHVHLKPKRGLENVNGKLTTEQKDSIRSDPRGAVEVAKDYSIHESTVYKINKN